MPRSTCPAHGGRAIERLWRALKLGFVADRGKPRGSSSFFRLDEPLLVAPARLLAERLHLTLKGYLGRMIAACQLGALDRSDPGPRSGALQCAHGWSLEPSRAEIPL